MISVSWLRAPLIRFIPITFSILPSFPIDASTNCFRGVDPTRLKTEFRSFPSYDRAEEIYDSAVKYLDAHYTHIRVNRGTFRRIEWDPEAGSFPPETVCDVRVVLNQKTGDDVAYLSLTLYSGEFKFCDEYGVCEEKPTIYGSIQIAVDLKRPSCEPLVWSDDPATGLRRRSVRAPVD